MLSLKIFTPDRKCAIAFAVSLMAAANAAYADIAGKAIFVLGEVKSVDPGKLERVLHKGDSINAGETIFTSLKGQLHILMSDGGMLSIRPNSEFRIDEYSYSENQATDKGLFSLVKGGFRSITGAIGHTNKSAYGVKTPVATIGIRGTDYVARLCANDCGGSANQNGLFVTVLTGGIAVANGSGSVDVSPGQFGYVADANVSPKLLPSAPDSGLFTASAARKPIDANVANSSQNASISDALSVSRTSSVLALPTQGTYSYTLTNAQMNPSTAMITTGTALNADFSQMTISGSINVSNTNGDTWNGTTGVMQINNHNATFGGNFSSVNATLAAGPTATAGGSLSGNLAGPAITTSTGPIPSGSVAFSMDATTTLGATSSVSGSATLQ